ncbi:MAG: hypothetical protein ACOVP8_03065 [Phycisphaerales bacterium]|jgi:hypothetical protein
MRAGNWAGLGVIFLVLTCIFPPAIIGALVCFIGMVVAIQVKPPQQLSGFKTANGLVQVSTNAHWSTFEQATGEFSGVCRLTMNALDDATRAKVIEQMRIGETLAITHKRTKDERGVIRDALLVTSASGVLLGNIPAQLEREYTEAFKADGASFRGRIHHIATDTKEPVVLAHFERCDKAYLDRVRRKTEMQKLTPWLIGVGATLLAIGAIWVYRSYTG